MSKLDVVKRTVKGAGLKLKKHSPEILIGLGVCGTVGGTFLACKETTKLNDILEESKEKIDTIKHCKEDEKLSEIVTDENYTEKDKKRDLKIVYTQTGVKILKLYAPSLILETLSIATIIKGTDIFKKRTIALGAAYAGLDTAFKDYRARVVDRYGEEVDNDIRLGNESKKIDVVETDEKTGKEKKEKKVVNVSTKKDDYCFRYFDESSPNFETNMDYNLMFTRAQQQYANDLLIARGYLFLNDVWDMLGLDRTKAGQIVGWKYNSSNPASDNYVDFRIKVVTVEDENGVMHEKVSLDPNVEGNILDLI